MQFTSKCLKCIGFILCRFTRSTPSSHTRTTSGMKKSNRSRDTRMQGFVQLAFIFSMFWRHVNPLFTPMSFSLLFFLNCMRILYLCLLCCVLFKSYHLFHCPCSLHWTILFTNQTWLGSKRFLKSQSHFSNSQRWNVFKVTHTHENKDSWIQKRSLKPVISLIHRDGMYKDWWKIKVLLTFCSTSFLISFLGIRHRVEDRPYCLCFQPCLCSGKRQTLSDMSILFEPRNLDNLLRCRISSLLDGLVTDQIHHSGTL